MRTRQTSFLAWTLCGIVTVSVWAQTGMTLARRGTNANASSLSDVVLFGAVLPFFAIVAALIVSRQPRNVIGWLLMFPALTAAIPAQSYVNGWATAPAMANPLLLLALWFQSWSWLLLIMPILFIPLLFPTGRPPSKGWGWLAIAGLIMCSVFILFATFSAKLGPVSAGPAGAWTVANPIGFLSPDAFPLLAWGVLLAGLTVGSAASLAVRYRRAPAVERMQIKWLLYACVTFVVVYIPGLVVNGQNVTTDSVVNLLFAISLMTIPLAIAVAILRYRLWDIDVIIRRTLVYLPLTAILAGVFAASMKVSQTLFGALLGTQSEAATVLTTLIVVAVFEPIKRLLQRIVDARFKEVSNPQERWLAYGEQVRTFVQMSEPISLARRLLEESVAVFEAKGGAVYLRNSGDVQQICAIGDWGNVADVAIPLEDHGIPLGQLALAVRRNGRPYDTHDRDSLTLNASAVAAAIALARSKTPRD
jgi:hypothetical protein